MTKRIILIRHGQTDWNLEGRYQGRTDVDLNDKGREQARLLRGRLRAEGAQNVYSSAMARARSFAGLAFPRRKINIRPRLNEISFGVFEGLTYGEISKIYPRLCRKWVKDYFGTKIPGGEAPRIFKRRVLSEFKKISSADNGAVIAIVTHGGVIHTIVKELFGVKKYENFIPELASISIIEIKKGAFRWVR